MFEDAISEHTHWFLGWTKTIVCGSLLENSAQYLHDDAHTHCDFGKWISNNASTRISRFQNFPLIAKIHRELHARGRDLLLVHLDGGKIPSSDFEGFIDLRKDFVEQLMLLDSELHMLILDPNIPALYKEL